MNGRFVLLVGLVLAALLGVWSYSRLMHYEPGETVSIDFAARPNEARTELGLLVGDGDFYLQRCCARSVSHRGETAVFNVRANDPPVKGNLRAEARLLSNRMGRPAVYRLDLTTPASWRSSPETAIVAQWHGTNDFFVLEPGRYPPLELAIEGDRWVIVKAWDARMRSANAGGGNTQGRKAIGSAPFAPGADTRWRIEARWSAGSDGYVRAFKDGRLVADDRGPNAFRDLIGPYMKFGVYVPEWKKHPDLKVAEREVSFRSASMAQL